MFTLPGDMTRFPEPESVETHQILTLAGTAISSVIASLPARSAKRERERERDHNEHVQAKS